MTHLIICNNFYICQPLGGSIEMVQAVNCRFSPWQRRRCPVHLGNPQCPPPENQLWRNSAEALAELYLPSESVPKTTVIIIISVIHINSIVLTTKLSVHIMHRNEHNCDINTSKTMGKIKCPFQCSCAVSVVKQEITSTCPRIFYRTNS